MDARLNNKIAIVPFGDKGLRLQFGQHISPELNQLIRKFTLILETEPIPGVQEWIPTYTAITILYDPWYTSYLKLTAQLKQISEKLDELELPPARLIYIPTCYGGKMGPDLAKVAHYHQLTEAEVIRLHAEPTYLIYMMGFSPGFPYLGGMNPRLATPRLASPRRKVPIGSVAIGGEQTGIYSMETPGGWHIIGQTPLQLYNPHRKEPILLRTGDYLKFVPISETEYKQIQQQIKAGDYQITKELIKKG